jgi:hypothetical protein
VCHQTMTLSDQKLSCYNVILAMDATKAR